MTASGARLTDKVCVITGAGGGIGEATALLFLEEGAIVGLLDTKSSELASVSQALAAKFGPDRVITCSTDITSEEQVEGAFERVYSRFGHLDSLMNIAGIRVVPGTAAEHSMSVWNKVFAVNFFGAVLCSKYAIPRMVESGGGSIVHLSTVAASAGRAGWAPYDSSKAALHALARDMACDHASQGVRVNVVCPGPTLTKFHVRNYAHSQHLDYDQAHRALKEQGASCLLNRQAEPREIAYALLFLASDESSFVTGSVMNVDGGAPDVQNAVPTIKP